MEASWIQWKRKCIMKVFGKLPCLTDWARILCLSWTPKVLTMLHLGWSGLGTPTHPEGLSSFCFFSVAWLLISSPNSTPANTATANTPLGVAGLPAGLGWSLRVKPKQTKIGRWWQTPDPGIKCHYEIADPFWCKENFGRDSFGRTDTPRGCCLGSTIPPKRFANFRSPSLERIGVNGRGGSLQHG